MNVLNKPAIGAAVGSGISWSDVLSNFLPINPINVFPLHTNYKINYDNISNNLTVDFN